MAAYKVGTLKRIGPPWILLTKFSITRGANVGNHLGSVEVSIEDQQDAPLLKDQYTSTILPC
jgi:hypothetical protein